MNVTKLNVTAEAASVALLEYKQHRNTYDKRDWEIERVYRAISKGKTVISAFDAIRAAGLDAQGRPRLAIMRADQEVCFCECSNSAKVIITNKHHSKAAEWHFEIPWTNRAVRGSYMRAMARLPRIPPQHRPAGDVLGNYQLLWEADWQDIPHDPMLLKRIGKDAWIVLAAWNLTEVEMNVLRSHAM